MLKKHLTKPLIILTSLLQLMLISYTSSVNGEVIKWKENGTTVSSTEANKLFPSVTGDGSGGAFLAWEDYRNTTGDIFVQRVNVNGTPLSSDKDATVDDTAAKRFPSIVKDGNGGAFIVWEDDRNKASGKGADIYIQKIDSNGNPVWTDINGIPEDKIVCSLAGNQWVPQIILTNDSTGDVIVTWEDHRNGMIGDIFAQRIGPDGSQKWTTDGKPVCTDASDQLYPAISSAGGGGAVIVWWDDRNSSSDIYGQRLDADGNIASGGQWVTDGIAITDADGDQWFPAIASDGNGNFIITWEDYRDDVNGISSNIYAKGVDGNGSSLLNFNDDIAICSNTEDQRFPRIAFSTGENSFIIAWEDYRNDTANYTADLYAQKVSISGIKSWTPNGTLIISAIDTQDTPSIASSEDTGIILAWEDFRNNSVYDIYAIPMPIPASITINDGADNTTTTNVTLDMWASSFGSTGSTISQMCISDNTDCNLWVDYSPMDYPWTITSVEGTKRIYAQFKDSDNQLSPVYYDEITMGHIAINEGAVYTNSANVTLTLSASAAKMQFSNDNSTWSAWENYATSRLLWPLDTTSGDGQKTVYVNFGNSSEQVLATYSDTIILDSTAPTIESTTPASGATGVGVNTSITITFNEAEGMDSNTISSANIYLTQGATPISSSVTYSSGSKTVTLTTDTQLELNTIYTVYITSNVKDLAGNPVAASSFSFTTIGDNTPPTGSITGAAYTNILNVTVTVSAIDNVGGSGVTDMQFNINGGTWEGWKPYNTSESLPLPSGDGPKTINVRFRDAAGNVSITYSHTIILDTAPPDINITSPATGLTNDNTPLLNYYTVLDGTVTVKVDGNTVSKVSEDSLDALTEGSHTVLVESIDLAGNTGYAEVTFTVDTIPPTVTVDTVTSPTKNSSQTIGGTRESGATITVTTNTVATAGAVSYPSATTWSCDITGLVEGANGITVTATDAATNSAAANASITYDSIPPAVTITSPATGITNNSTPTLTYTVNDGTVVVKVDGVTVNKVSGNNLDSLSDGSHTVRVEATDLAGNTGFDEVTFTVDTLVTAINIDPVSTPTKINSQTITGSVEAGSTVSVVTDTAASDGAATVTGNTWSYTITGLVEGPNIITVTATDTVGNIATSTSSITLDTIAPNVTISSPVTGITNNKTPTLTFSVSDGTVVVKVDGVIVNKVLGNNLDTLTDGPHIVRVEATDLAGNTGFAEVTFAVDTTPPAPEPGVTPTISLDSAVVISGQTYYSYSKIAASWTSFSDASAGLQEYRIAIGTSDGGTNILNWTETTVPSYITGDISSDHFGKTLYIGVKAVDNLGTESSILSTSFVYTPADINSKEGQGDGRVDGFDLGMLGIAFGSTTGGGADINRDGKVDGNDLIVLGINFGKVKQ